MSSELAQATVVTRRRRLGLELALVIAVSLAVLLPGIWRYSLVDPWETHYGEVARQMASRGDPVSLWWPGSPDERAEFWSKPVLTFWLSAIAAAANSEQHSPRGGIGRRAWFRSMCRKVWGFESLRGHHKIPQKSRSALKKDFTAAPEIS